MAIPALKPKHEALCAQRYAAVLAEAFHQQPFLSVTDWASENRHLTGAESGRYNSLRCPYQRAIQDAFNDPEVREITWQSAERVGKSTVGANVLGYIIDRELTDLLWMMPSRESMSDFLKDEIEPMIRAWKRRSARAGNRVSWGGPTTLAERVF
jgi:phage terminase large subunit GpA-like protein